MLFQNRHVYCKVGLFHERFQKRPGLFTQLQIVNQAAIQREHLEAKAKPSSNQIPLKIFPPFRVLLKEGGRNFLAT